MEILKFPQKPSTNSFRLDVPYNNQNDNSPNKGQGPGYRQCDLTCAAMLAKYLKPSLWGQYKDFANGMQDVLQNYGDTTDHGAITEALHSLGIASYFSYTASVNDAMKSLYHGCPVLTGTKYKSGGHILLFVGRTPEYVLAHDPYGIRAGASDRWIEIGDEAGKFDALSYNWLSSMVFDIGNEAGWCRFVTAVDGVPTGVPAGL